MLCLNLFILTTGAFSTVRGGDNEYLGQFDTMLVTNTENLERIVFKSVSNSNLKGKTFSEDAHITSNRLLNPTNGQPSLVSILVEEPDEKPVIFIDLNADNNFSDGEKFTFRREEKDNPYLFITTVNVPVPILSKNLWKKTV